MPTNTPSPFAIYNKIPGLLLILDHNDRVLGVSDRWLAVLGYTRGEIIGCLCQHFLPPTVSSLTQMLYGADGPQPEQVAEAEGQFIKQNGELISVALTATAEYTADGELAHIFVAIRDVTRHKRAEHFLHTLSENIAGITGEDFFRSLIDQLSQMLAAPYVFVTECTDRVLPRVRTLASLEHQVFVESAEWNVRGTTCEGVLEGKICYYPEQLGRLYPEYLQKRQSYIGIPIYDSQRTIVGHLAVFDVKPTDYNPQEIAVLQIFAARAGVEIERKRAEEALRHHRNQLSRLNEQLRDQNLYLEQEIHARTNEIQQRTQVAESLSAMVAILNSNRSLTEILEYILATATQLLGTRSGAIYRLQPDQQTLLIQATRGLPAAYAAEVTFATERSFLGQAILQRQPIVISNLSSVLREAANQYDLPRNALLAESYQTLLAVPLIRQRGVAEAEEIHGGIALYYPENRAFADEEIGLAMAFAGQAALAIQNADLRKRVEQMAVTEERNRLARELHDSVTQSLYSMTLLAEGWRRMAVAGQSVDLNEALSELGNISQQALREMRLLVYELRPPILEQEGLARALQERLNIVEKRAGVETRLQIEGNFRLPLPIEEGLFGVAQEALNNALKHAAATHVLVRVQMTPQTAVLEVKDNGQGFDLATLPERQGVGMSSMRERVEKLVGVLTINSSPGQGAVVRVQVPLQGRQAP